jgi:hypothetical protein
MRKLVAIAALSVAGMGAMAGTAAAATEEPETGTIIDYANTYSSPSNTSVRVHQLTPGEKVETLCFREGQVVNGNRYWFLIRAGGQTAFVHRDSISPPADLERC